MLENLCNFLCMAKARGPVVRQKHGLRVYLLGSNEVLLQHPSAACGFSPRQSFPLGLSHVGSL